MVTVPSVSEDAFLVANWTTATVRALANMLGWKEKAVRDRARKLGLPGRREIAQAIARKADADRLARRKAVRPLERQSVDQGARPTTQGWSDGWSISPPTRQQLMRGR
jgi:hypothetical protein